MYTKVFVCLAILSVTYGAPNHLKTVIVEKQVPPANGVAVGNLGASASWGGYSASAGIGGGTSASAGASAGVGGGNKGGGTFFDSIFNIPISVLSSVNRHLNNRAEQGFPPRRQLQRGKGRRWRYYDDYADEGSAATLHGAGAGASASAGANSGVGYRAAEAGAGATAGASVNVRKNYDSTFAIPIAALTSVNQFLNGK
ncbi:uncharacterized protein isoform X2 [Rhodnius prolixus]|uniref:uncharacterized protein isoform X2 n=1 Tax=Rhodnius prolixus TaxID=13249 RepID=UPI003D18B25C